MSPLIIVIAVLMILLIVGAPVVFAIAASALSYFMVNPNMFGSLYTYVHKFFTGMDSFVLLCIPLFVLAGEIMQKSGMMSSLVKFAQIIVGRFRGGLAYVNVFVSMLFGGISGSGLADVSALGPVEINMMKEGGYPVAFSAALTATSSIQGPIIPPSIPFVLFASLTQVSVGALFLGGAIPGILIGLGQMTVIFIMSRIKGFPKFDLKYSFKEFLSAIGSSASALLMPVIILGGILGGIFTPTEAAAVAVAYSFLIAFVVNRNISLKDIRQILANTARITSSIYLILGFVSIISWILAMEQVPFLIKNAIQTYAPSPYLLLFIVNLFFLFNGMWISDVAQLVLFAPLFTPIFASMGINPIHFGVVMVVNVMISMITPPYGVALYLSAAISGESLRSIVKETLPFTLVSIIVLLLVTFVPEISLFIPRLFGLIK